MDATRLDDKVQSVKGALGWFAAASIELLRSDDLDNRRVATPVDRSPTSGADLALAALPLSRCPLQAACAEAHLRQPSHANGSNK